MSGQRNGWRKVAYIFLPPLSSPPLLLWRHTQTCLAKHTQVGHLSVHTCIRTEHTHTHTHTLTRTFTYVHRLSSNKMSLFWEKMQMPLRDGTQSIYLWLSTLQSPVNCKYSWVRSHMLLPRRRKTRNFTYFYTIYVFYEAETDGLLKTLLTVTIFKNFVKKAKCAKL